MTTTEILGTPKASETAPVGGFPLGDTVSVDPVESTIGDEQVGPQRLVVEELASRFPPEEAAAAQAELTALFSGEDAAEADARYRRGLADVTSRDKNRNRSPDALFYIRVQNLTELAASIHDHYGS